MINVYKGSKIYIMCTPENATGGTELLHQLSNKLNSLGFNSFLFYCPCSDNPVHPNFNVYNTAYTLSLENDPENILIVPEIMFHFLDDIKNIDRIRKCVWWLSINNYFNEFNPKYGYLKPLQFLRDFGKIVFLKYKIAKYSLQYQLVQSEYAHHYLKKREIKSQYLSDSLNKKFITDASNIDIKSKQDTILYNPKKGLAFTQKIIDAAPHLNWVPLINLSVDEVADLLKHAKVYIDFGHHPGKDRFPREAAVSMCCVITNKKGAAAFQKDIDIPEKYKIEDKPQNIPRIVSLIESCLKNFDNDIHDFKIYRGTILNEENVFENEIKNIFIKAY